MGESGEGFEKNLFLFASGGRFRGEVCILVSEFGEVVGR